MISNTYVVIPSLNPDGHLIETIKGLIDVGFRHFVIVDDGSDDDHRRYFPKSNQYIQVIHHKQNRGKGMALKTAFKYIAKYAKDADYIVTVDGDGQHAPQDARACVEALIGRDDAIVLGARNFKDDSVPTRSRLGNNITLFVFRYLCGIKIADTQTGLRAMPVSLIPTLIKIPGDRFDYETNMLLKCKQVGIDIDEVPIETVYIEENHASHFRTVTDSWLIYRFIFAYFITAGISFLIDISLFHILRKFILASLPIALMTVLATVIARAVSSIINYTLNKKKVFDYDKNSDKKDTTFWRYYALAIPQMCVSAGAVTLLVTIFPKLAAIETLCKIIVDCIIFLVNYRVQRSWVFTQKKKEPEEPIEDGPKHMIYKKPNIVGRVFLCIFTFILMVIMTAAAFCLVICYGPSDTVRNMCVLSAKQASATKWLPGLFLSDEKIEEILKKSETIKADTRTVEDLTHEVSEDEWKDSDNGIKLIYEQNEKFKSYICLVRDPARVSVGVSSENFSTATEGMRIFKIVDKYNAKIVLNGGGFADPGGVGTGATPNGITYSKGKCVYAVASKLSFVGFDNNNKLVVHEGMTPKLGTELGLRDGCSFKTGQVLIEQNGTQVKLNYADDDVGTAQRTAIGQRADGTVIMLVTDGRSGESIGATRNDIIDAMVKYGAVNACMLDGGSSTLLYYRDYIKIYNIDESTLDDYQKQGLVNKYKAFTAPRRMPAYFIVSGE